MPTLETILAELKATASEKTRTTYIRHGAPADRTLGVSVAEMKRIAKSIRKQQALAAELYDSGIFDAMYVAGLVLDGKLVSPQQLQSWVDAAAHMPMIFEYTIPWLAVENPAARSLANAWIASNAEHRGAAGWCTYAGILATTPDDQLNLAEVRCLLESIPGRMDGAANRVRATMNSFVICAGTYVLPLLAEAEATARQLGAVAVDVGDTACEIPVAADRIAKTHAMGRAGKKRKTIRC